MPPKIPGFPHITTTKIPNADGKKWASKTSAQGECIVRGIVGEARLALDDEGNPRVKLPGTTLVMTKEDDGTGNGEAVIRLPADAKPGEGGGVYYVDDDVERGDIDGVGGPYRVSVVVPGGEA